MNQKLLLITAPTGGGKSSLCGELPQEKYEIVSFDSRQVYKYLEKGTAKPSPTLREKVPHHLIDFLEPSEALDAKTYSQMAEEAVLSIWKRGKTPILTAGTGFYLKAFLNGMYVVPGISEETAKKVEAMPLSAKVEMLKDLDPEAFSSIHIHDEYRVTRALEVNLSGKKWSESKGEKEEGFLDRYSPVLDGIWIDWEREELYRRINERALEIIENGVLEETLYVANQFGRNCPGLSSLGYNFVLDYLDSRITKKELIEKFSQCHRNYAKKQITWFKRETYLKPYKMSEVLSYLCI